MAKVEKPIRLMVTRKVPLRPTRSPMRPKIRAPIGRKAKPTAKAPRAKTYPAVSLSPAKKVLDRMAARGTKRKKSYHSKAVPAAEAATTRIMLVVLGPALAPAVVLATVMDSPLVSGEALHRRGRVRKTA